MSTKQSNRPELTLGSFSGQPRALPLLQAISVASRKLDDIGAWPGHDFAPYDIRIVAGNGIVTKWGVSKNSKPGRSLAINPLDPLRIEIGIDLFVNGLGGQLRQASQLPNETIMFALLAHETFHLTELDRMSLSGVPFESRLCSYASAIRPDFDPAWSDLARRLAEEFQTKRSVGGDRHLQRLIDLEHWKSADIVSEACADMMSLRLLSLTEPNWQQFSNALIAFRMAVENAAIAAGPSHCPDYQIGQALAALVPMLIADPTLSEKTIHIETWEMSINTLMAKGGLSPETRAAIGSLPNPLRHIAVPASKPKSKWSF